MKVALVHDYLREFGGAERVLIALHEMFPNAPVYTAFFDPKVMGKHAQHFAGWDIRETWLAKIPFFKKLHSPLRFLAPVAFSHLDLSEFDLVITSSNAYFAKAVKVPRGKHVCYCHTPPRVLWGYSAMTDWRSNPILRFAGTLLNHFLRVVDLKISRENVDVFIANSLETQHRIRKFYKRDSVVVYPPVAVPEKPKLIPLKDRAYYLYVNRLALAKHPELAVEACTRLGLPLKVVGEGKMLDTLQQQAGPTIEFLGAVSDEELHELYAGAKALLYPAEDEDFGIVPVEAMGYGTPVVAHNSGGPRETIVTGKTGVFFDDLTAKSLIDALKKLQKATFDPQKIHTHARQFSLASFQKNMRRVLDEILPKQ